MLSEAILGESAETLAVQSKEEAKDIALSLASQAHKSILIASRDLDHFLYDNEPFAASILSMAAASRYANIRILIHESEKCVIDGHRVVTISQRLTSHIFIRRFGVDHKNYNEAFIVADHMGYLHRPVADRYHGQACFADERKCRSFIDFFNKAWELGESDANLRRLHI